MPVPIVWMVGLALYDVARTADLDQVELTPLPAAVRVLLTDRSARRVARLQPGHTQRSGGRLRARDRQKLRTGVRPGGPWRRWRDGAVDVLLHHLMNAHTPLGQDPVLLDLLDYVQAADVRRNWYAAPNRTPLLTPDEPGARR